MNNKLKYLIFALFTFLCFNLKVSATTYVDYTSKYVLTMPEYSFENDLIDSTHSVQEFFDDMVSLGNSSSTYELIITVDTLFQHNFRNYHLYLIPKNIDLTHYTSYFGYSNYNNKYFSSLNFNSLNFYHESISVYNGNSTWGADYTVSEQYLAWKSCLVGSSCPYLNNGAFETQGLRTFVQLASSTNLSNSFVFLDYSSSSYFYPNQVHQTSLIYYSSFPIHFQNQSTLNDSFDYIKSLKINGVDYLVDDVIPTYCQLYDLCSETSSVVVFNDYQTSLRTIYGSFEPGQLSSYYINVKFDTDIEPLDYFNNLGYTWNCYGRVNNNGYYSYEQFPYCDFERNSNSSTGIDFNYSNFMVYDLNDNPITNLSRYDKIFVYISHQYKNDSLTTILHNLSISSNQFVIYSDAFSGPIYETFDNLSDNFRMFLTTSKSTYSYIWGKYSIDYDTSFFNIRQQSYDITNFQESINPGWIASNFNRYSVNNSSNTGLMIFYMYYQYDEPLNYPFTLHLVFFPDIVISLNETVSSDNFYYYDNTGTIISSNITIDYDFNTYDNYDLSYYLKQVSSFVDDLSESAYTFSIYTQTFYDSLPFPFQTFIFILFILVCTYFVYLLIKRK